MNFNYQTRQKDYGSSGEVDGSLVDSLIRNGITGGNYLLESVRQHRDRGITRIAEPSEDFDINGEEATDILNQIPAEKQHKLYDAQSLEELKFNANLMEKQIESMKYMNQELGAVGSFFAIGATSIFDPATGFAYGAVAKMNNMIKVYDKLSGLKKAALLGSEAAVIEGMSAAEMEYHGSKDYENVPISAAAAFLLVGGITQATESMSKAATTRSADAYKTMDERFEQLHQKGAANNEIVKDEIVAASLAEIDYSTLQPVRSTATKWLDLATGGKTSFFSSGIRRAQNKGGVLSAEAAKHDLGVYQLKDAQGNVLDTSTKNGMDIWYEQRILYFDQYRKSNDLYNMFKDEQIKTNGKVEIDEVQFDNMVLNKYREAELAYRAKKVAIESEYRDSQEYLELQSNSEASFKIEEEKKFGDKFDDKKYQANIEREKTQDALKKDTERNLQLEVQAKMKTEPEYEFGSGDKFLDEGIMIKQEYFDSIGKRMIDNGLFKEGEIDSRFYSPREWNENAIMNMDTSESTGIILNALKNSPEYKHEHTKLVSKLNDLLAESKLTQDTVDGTERAIMQREIELLDSRIKSLENSSEDLANVMNGEKDPFVMQRPFVDTSSDLSKEVLNRLTGKQNNQQQDILEGIGLKKGGSELNESLVNRPDFAEIDMLWKLSGKPDIALVNGGSVAGKYSFSSVAGKVKHNIVINKQMNKEKWVDHLKHELVHAATSAQYKMNPSFKMEVDDIFEQVKQFYPESTNKNTYFAKEPQEMLAEAFSNPAAAKALNEIAYIDKKGIVTKKSLWNRLVDIILAPIGMKIKSGSALEAIQSSLNRNLSKQKIRMKRSDASKKIQSLNKELRQARKDKNKKLENEISIKLSKIVVGKIKNKNGTKTELTQENMQKDIKKLRAKLLQKQLDLKTKSDDVYGEAISKAQDELNALKQRAEFQARNMVRRVNKPRDKQESSMDQRDVLPSRLRGRVLSIDPTDEQVQGLLLGSRDSLAKYHYNTSGRIATSGSTGFSRYEDYRDYLKTVKGLDDDDMDLLLDLFEDVQGTKQLAKNPNSFHQLFLRGASNFNYATMGGQFGMYGVSEIGVPVWRLGFQYMNEIAPAFDVVKKMYKGEALTKAEADLVMMSDGTNIFEHKARNRMSDTFDPNEFSTEPITIGQKIVDHTSKASRGMFRYSGLEGITTITKIALPRAIMRNIMTEYIKNPGVVARDMQRFGVSTDLIEQMMKQPMKTKNGRIVEFNFSEWDPKVADKLNGIVSRISRETIVVPDATRLPSWMTDANENIWLLVKLAKQFMSFSMVAHERLLLAGFEEKRARMMIGAMVSGGILAAYQAGSEKAASELGLIKDKDRRYDLDTEKGWTNLAEYTVTRQSFSGNLGQAYDFIREVTDPSRSYAATTKAFGGITAGRMITAGRGIVDAFEGDIGNRTQAHTLRSLVFFNNIVGVDSLTKYLAREAIDKDY